MPKLQISLTQMTPMVHFQANEDGATLRASELKPKLDQYLMEHAFRGQRQAYAEFLIGAGARQLRDSDMPDAFDYRVRISAPGDHSVELFRSTTGYNGITRTYPTGSIWFKDEQDFKRWGSFVKGTGTVKVVFLSRHPKLIEAIRQWIAPFFAATNFGFRQSKGFGSFLPVECARNRFAYENCLRKHLAYTDWQNGETQPLALCFTAPTRYNQGWESALNDIRDIWQAIRSGINRGTNRYTPSFLMKNYAKTERSGLKKYDNEKKLMKVKLLQGLSGQINQHESYTVQGYTGGDNSGHAFHDGGVYEYDNERCSPRDLMGEKDGRFMRAMLGLSPFVEFRQIEFKTSENRPFSKTVRINISDSDERVERFKSPLTFKPVCFGNQWMYYLIPSSIPEEMFGRKFTFTPEIVGEHYSINHDMEVSTPTQDEFNLMQFLHALYEYNNHQMNLTAVNQRFAVQEVK